MSHEQFKPHPNQFIKHYAGRLACLAANTAIFLNNRVAFNNSLKSEQRKRAKELL